MRLDPIGDLRYSNFATAVSYHRQKDKKQILMLGDSRIAHWYPLPEYERIQVIQAGFAGFTSKQIDLLQHQFMEMIEPEVVILEVGINDIKSIGLFTDRREQILERIKHHLDSIVKQWHQHGIHVMILTVFPNGPCPLLRRPVWSETISQDIDIINSYIKTMSSGQTTIIDCDTILKHGGFIRKEYQKDELHLNQKGYEQLNKVLMPYIEQYIQSISSLDARSAVLPL